MIVVCCWLLVGCWLVVGWLLVGGSLLFVVGWWLLNKEQRTNNQEQRTNNNQLTTIRIYYPTHEAEPLFGHSQGDPGNENTLLVVGGWWLLVGCWLVVVCCLLLVGCWLVVEQRTNNNQQTTKNKQQRTTNNNPYILPYTRGRASRRAFPGRPWEREYFVGGCLLFVVGWLLVGC